MFEKTIPTIPNTQTIANDQFKGF